MKAYSGKIVANSGTLLGGVFEHVSHPFERFDDAASWAEQAEKVNVSAGRDVSGPVVVETSHPEPITHEEVWGK